ncbi:MAG: hypothetical protein ACMG6E_05770 [Candidatus Roizmanbacteria bacterium]
MGLHVGDDLALEGVVSQLLLPAATIRGPVSTLLEEEVSLLLLVELLRLLAALFAAT